MFGAISIIAVILAIPTYGLSLLILFFLWRARNNDQTRAIATAAINSLAQDRPIALPFGHISPIVKYFELHSSTADGAYRIKHNDGSESFFGYVVVRGTEESVVHVTAVGRKIFVSTLSTPYPFGQDILSLIAKKQFIDEVMNADVAVRSQNL